MVTATPISIRIEAFGENVIARELLRFSSRLVDASPAFEAIADMFYASEERQFETEGAWASGGWAPLAPSTLADKMRRGFDLRILHRTGAAEAALTSADAEGSVKEITPESMFVGVTGDGPVGYMKYHQQVPYRSSWLPMRKPVELPGDVRVGMVKTMQEFLVHGVTP